MSKNEIAERLWVGSHPESDPAAEGFTLLVLTAYQFQDASAFRVRVHHAPLTDDAFCIVKGDIERCHAAAKACVEELKIGGKVLVTCREGLNRSAWVVARALLMTGGCHEPVTAVIACALLMTGHGSATAVIERLQQMRAGSLYNWFFQQELQGLSLQRPLA